MSEKLLRENLGELRLRYFTMRRERDDLMAANVLVSQENVRLRAALEKIAGALCVALRIRWILRNEQRSGAPADFLPNGWASRNPGYYGGTDNGCDDE